MNSSLAPRAQAARQTWPALDAAADDEQAPFEEWALDEVDSDFALPMTKSHRAFDAAFD